MDLRTLRAEIPALDDSIYCNWGASGPAPQSVVEATNGALAAFETAGHTEENPYNRAQEIFDTTRASIADLLGSTEDEIALTQSTTDGINRVISALDWDETDRVVTTDAEHPATDLPLDRLARTAGVEIIRVSTDGGKLDQDSVVSALSGASLFVFSAIDWLYGSRRPVGELVEIAHETDVPVLVDAVQAIGQTPVDLATWDAEFVAGAGHKWLCGPWGAGFLYVDAPTISECSPAGIGYRSVENPDEEYTLHPSARRFEVSTTGVAPYVGLQQAIEHQQSIGTETIETKITGLVAEIKGQLPADTVASPDDFHPGLVTVHVDDAAAAVEHLQQQDITVRSLPKDGLVRISLHAVNTETAVTQVCDHLGSFLEVRA